MDSRPYEKILSLIINGVEHIQKYPKLGPNQGINDARDFWGYPIFQIAPHYRLSHILVNGKSVRYGPRDIFRTPQALLTIKPFFRPSAPRNQSAPVSKEKLCCDFPPQADPKPRIEISTPDRPLISEQRLL